MLFAGADPFTEDDHGRNALYYALRRSAGSSVNTHLHSHNSHQVHLLHHHASTGYCTKTLLSQVVVSSTMAANCEMVHDLVEAMSQPQTLGRLCRTVIRR